MSWFGLKLHHISSSLVHLCLIGCSFNYHLAIDLFRVCANNPSLWNIYLGLGPTIWYLFSLLWFYISYFPFRSPAHANRTDLDVYGSIISHISSARSRYTNPLSFQYRLIWTLLSAWSTLTLKMSDHVDVGYLYHLCFLPSWKCVEHNLGLTDFPFQQCLGPSCWVSFCRCETFSHDILGSWYTRCTPQGCWTYLMPLLWTL